MRRVVIALACLAAVVATFACAKKPAEVDLRIGLVAELTGELAAVGASCKNGAELAIAEINHAGGLEFGGRRHGVGLVVEDSKSTADEAAAAAKRLAQQEGVVAIVGPNASLGAIPASDVAESSGVLLVSPWSTNLRTTRDAAGKPKQWVYRACFTDDFEGHVLAKFAQGYMHASKAAVLYAIDSPAPKSQAELFKQDFEQGGGKVVAFESYKEAETDYTPALKRIQAAGPEVLFLPAYFSDAPKQMTQAHAAGLTAPFLGSDNWGRPELLKGAGKEAEGAFFCTHYAADAKNETTGRFVVDYRKKYGGQTPDDVAALTYDAVTMLFKALASAGKADRTALRDAYAKLPDFDGVTGKIRYAGSHDPVKTAVMAQIKGGSFTFVTNIEP